MMSPPPVVVVVCDPPVPLPVPLPVPSCFVLLDEELERSFSRRMSRLWFESVFTTRSSHL